MKNETTKTKEFNRTYTSFMEWYNYVLKYRTGIYRLNRRRDTPQNYYEKNTNNTNPLDCID